jgi:hypothetical protein
LSSGQAACGLRLRVLGMVYSRNYEGAAAAKLHAVFAAGIQVRVLLADLDHLLMCDAVASPLSPLRPPTPPPSVGYGVLQKLRRSRVNTRSERAHDVRLSCWPSD